MELPGSGYLYTIAALAMTFVGFIFDCARFSSRYESFCDYSSFIRMAIWNSVFRRQHLQCSAPLLATFGLSVPVIWRVTSLIIVIVIIGHLWITLHRFLASVRKASSAFSGQFRHHGHRHRCAARKCGRFTIRSASLGRLQPQQHCGSLLGRRSSC